MATPDMDVIKEIPGYKVILKAILKSQIQQLVEQLASTTDEESVILTASVTDGTLCHLGSNSGKSFLEDHEDFKSQFLGFCLKRHHRRKQEEEQEKERERQEKERQERERQEALRNIPTTPPRFGGPRQGGYMVRSPRFQSPRQQGVHPVALTRAGGMNIRGPGVRHEPYPMNRPPRRPSFDGPGPRGPAPGMRLPVGNANQVIKIEPDDSSQGSTDTSGQIVAGSTGDPSHSSSPSQAQISAKTERDDDTRSESSSSTTANETTSDLKFSDSAPPEGLSLDSDLSNLIPPMDNSGAGGSDNQDSQPASSAPPTPGSDQNVNVKLEAISESEMELEITGVELGPRPSVPDTMVSQDPGSWEQGASGSQADLHGNQMGYNLPDMKPGIPVFMNPGQGQGQGQGPPSDPDSGFKFICKDCGMGFSFKSTYVIHRRVHTGLRPFVCSICGKACAQKNNLKSHMYNKHGKTFH